VIVALDGIIEHFGTNSVVIKVGPMSLTLSTPTSTLSELGKIGDKVHLHTHLHVREDNIALFGFSSSDQLALFQSLITVSGIGPKTALGILSALNPDKLVSAIEGENLDVLSQVPGIGKKTAARLVLELKGKLAKEWAGVISSAVTQEDADVIAGLTGLGYSLREATEAASTLSDSKGLKLEEKVRLALQRLSRA
jgi:Holliday junction DNA helicase RuvA